MKAAGYVRVSTPTQATEGESLKTQGEAIEKYAKDKGLELVRIYADKGVSGAKKDRPALTELLDDAREKNFDCLIVQRLSRFGRNARDLLNNVEVLKENGIQFVSLKESIDLSHAYGRFMFQMLGAIAELEREVIREQMAENKYARWREGKTFIGTLPYGYRWNKETKKIETVEEDVKVYKRIVDLYLNQGLSFSDIASGLKEEGIKSRRSCFTSSTISGILKNPAYYGRLLVNTRRYDGKKRTKERKHPSDHIEFPIPAIIAKTEWDRIQERTDFNKRKGKRITKAGSYWLRDVLECGQCGGTIKPRHGMKRNDGTFLRYYSCYWSGTSDKELEAHGRERCSLPYITAGGLENEVWRKLVRRTFILEEFEMNPEIQKIRLRRDGKLKETWFDELVDPRRFEREINSLESQKKRLMGELQRKKLSHERLFGMTEETEFSKERFIERMREIHDEIARIEGELSETDERLARLEKARSNDRRLREFLRNKRGMLRKLGEELGSLSPDDKKTFIQSMLEGKIKVRKGKKKEPWSLEIPGVFSPAVIERFVKEGKVSHVSLDADVSRYST